MVLAVGNRQVEKLQQRVALWQRSEWPLDPGRAASLLGGDGEARGSVEPAAEALWGREDAL
jgi:hypothetical protein